MDGVININKPKDWTSQDVCAKLRSRLHIKKIGHTGTLDPMATGVLPVCIGKATRIIEYYDKDLKSYRASMRLGLETDTLDITGEILKTCDYSYVSEKAVREAFRAYIGVIEQTPPKYSALRIDGRRAYELAREGKEFALKGRIVQISSNEIISIDLDRGLIEFEVSCSKGTYIRTMIDDIGRALGCGAVMTALERTASGCFTLENAITLDELADMGDGEIAKSVIPMDGTLTKLGKIILDDNRVTAFTNGNPSFLASCRIIQESGFDGLYRVYSGDRFIGVAEISEDALVPKKVLL